MNKNLFKTAYLISLLFLTFFLPSKVLAEEKIDRFDTQIKIDSTGKIFVVEKIYYDFGNSSRHGIFRDIPYTKTNQNGKKFKLTLGDFQVTDDQGNKYHFSKSISNGNVSLKIGDADKLVSGKKYYQIDYTVSGAITYFEDHDELYWNFTGNDWQVPILESKNSVVLPAEIKPNDIHVVCFTGSYQSTENNCQTNVTNNSITLTSNKILQPGEGITGSIGFPKGYVAELLPKADHTDLIIKIVLIFVGLGLFFWYFIVPILVFKSRYANKKFLDKNKQIVAAWFDPPKNDDGIFYTPAEVGVLIDKKPDYKEVTATIISLAQRGYLKIKKEEKQGLLDHLDFNDEFRFDKLKDYENDKELKEYEKLILEGLFEDSETTTTKELKKDRQFGSDIKSFMETVVDALEEKNLFEQDLSDSRIKKLLLDIFAWMSFNVLLIVVNLIFRNYFIRFNKKGVDKYSKTASLFNFLKSQDEQLDFQADRMMFFERLLPYATAFGVEDVWINRFKDLQNIETDWYEGNIANAAAFSAITNNIGNSIQTSMNYYSSSSSSSGFSSGFSGGGFSGGGGGGGGGGSW